MSKAEGSFSGMRKYLEQKMIATAWKGRVRYNCSTAVGMDGCRFFELYIDNICVKRFSWETVNSYFIENGIAEKVSPMDTRDYWEGFWELMAKYPMEKRTEYTDTEFCEALEVYRNEKISESIHSPNPLVVMFALFDRRVGKRTLNRLEEEMRERPEWLRELYYMRNNLMKYSVKLIIKKTVESGEVFLEQSIIMVNAVSFDDAYKKAEQYIKECELDYSYKNIYGASVHSEVVSLADCFLVYEEQKVSEVYSTIIKSSADLPADTIIELWEKSSTNEEMLPLRHE